MLELDCHPEVIRFLRGSKVHGRKIPQVRFQIVGCKTYALVSSPMQYVKLKELLSEYGHLEYEFEAQKIMRARILSKLHREILNYQTSKWDDEWDIYISWSSPTKIHISGITEKLRRKLIEIKWLVNYETVCRAFTPDTHRILSEGGVFSELERRFGDQLSIQNDSKNEVVLIGGKTQIVNASGFLTRKTTEIKRVSLQEGELDERKSRYISKSIRQGTFIAKKISRALHKRKIKVTFCLQDERLTVAAMDERSIKSALQYLDVLISCENLPNQITADLFREDTWEEMRKGILEKFDVLPIVETNVVQLVGLRENVNLCIAEVERSNYGVEVVHTVTPAVAKLLLGTGSEFIHSFGSENVCILVKASGEVVLRGQKNAFKSVKDNFVSKLKRIATKEFSLKDFFAEYLLCEKGKEVVSDIETKLRCSISVENTAMKLEEAEDLQHCQERYDPKVLSHCLVETAAGGKVKIQLHGRRDFSSYRCDVLVHPYSANSDVISGMSHVILRKAGQTIWDELRRGSSSTEYRPATLLTSAGDLSACNHIVHICLPSSAGEPTYRDQLSDCIMNVFREADAVEARVVAIPVGNDDSLWRINFFGKIIVQCLENAMPLFLKQVDLIDLCSKPAGVVQEFSSEIIGNIKPAADKGHNEEETKTVILKRTNRNRVNIKPGIGRLTKKEWTECVTRRIRKASELKMKAVEIPIAPHKNSAQSAQWTKSAIEEFWTKSAIAEFWRNSANEEFSHKRPNIFALRVDADDPQLILAYESVFCDLKREEPEPSAEAKDGEPKEISIGPVNIAVKIGDITEETTDAIVNSTNRDFNLYQGVLSSKILEKAGGMVALECYLAEGELVRVTDAGQLPSKKIVHAVVIRDREELGRIITAILKAVNDHGLSTLSIPPIGTGNVGLSCDVVALEMRRAIEHFIEANLHELYINEINIVVSDEHVRDEFAKWIVDVPCRRTLTGDLILREAWEETWRVLLLLIQCILWLVRKLKVILVPEKSSKLSISGFNRVTLDEAFGLLTREMESRKKVEIISDCRISNLSSWHQRKIKRLKKTHKVEVLFRKNEIYITGFMCNPLNARKEVDSMLSEYQAPDTKVISMWQRDSGRNKMVFCQRVNHILEKAFEKQLPVAHIHDYNDGGGYAIEYDIHFSDMYEGTSNAGATLKRITSSNQNSDIPHEWDEMGKIPLRVPIASHSAEYKKIEKIISDKAEYFCIIYVERIQNKALYKQYTAKKEEVTHKHTHRDDIEVEKILFHGTSEDAVESIFRNGFNRSYSGKNATLFGHGTYFAPDPNIAHGYAEERFDGSRKLFMANVLTGNFTKGSGNDRVPPKIEGTLEHYDSLVDDTTNPRKFVIFHDAAAYPSYLIKYKLKK